MIRIDWYKKLVDNLEECFHEAETNDELVLLGILLSVLNDTLEEVQ